MAMQGARVCRATNGDVGGGGRRPSHLPLALPHPWRIDLRSLSLTIRWDGILDVHRFDLVVPGFASVRSEDPSVQPSHVPMKPFLSNRSEPRGGKGRSVRRDPGEFTTRVNSMVRWRLATTTKAKMAMTTTHLSTSEREFVRDGVVEDVRSDGRRRVDFRRVHVQVGNIPQANGSSRVTVGE